MKTTMIYGIALRGDIGLVPIYVRCGQQRKQLRTYYLKNKGLLLSQPVYGIRVEPRQMSNPSKCMPHLTRLFDLLMQRNKKVVKQRKARIMQVKFPSEDDSEWWQDEAKYYFDRQEGVIFY